MASQLAIIIVIILFIGVLVPTQQILTLSVNIPPSQENVVLVKERLPYFQYLYFKETLQKRSFGNVLVNITIQDSLNQIVWNDFYYLSQGTFTIKTFQPLSRNDIVIVEIPQYDNFRKAILIE